MDNFVRKSNDLSLDANASFINKAIFRDFCMNSGILEVRSNIKEPFQRTNHFNNMKVHVLVDTDDVISVQHIDISSHMFPIFAPLYDNIAVSNEYSRLCNLEVLTYNKNEKDKFDESGEYKLYPICGK